MRRHLNTVLIDLGAAVLLLVAAAPAVLAPVGTSAVADRPHRSHGVAPVVRELGVPVTAGRSGLRPGSVADTGRRSTRHFSMLGVTWAPGPSYADVGVEVQVHTGQGWTGWQRLGRDDDGPGRAGTEPLWVGDADGVRTRVVSHGAAPRGLRVSLIDPGVSPGDTAPRPVAATTAAAAGTVAEPAIVSRAGWGADESLTSNCENGLYGDTVRVAFVHHTAGTNDYTAADSPALVRGIYAYHTQSRGWCDIGYNFLVDRFGTVFEGRRGGVDLPVFGAHTSGYNFDSTGVALMGNFQDVDPTPEMMSSLANLLAWKLASNYRDPEGVDTVGGKTFSVISGHRDGVATECPGQHVYDLLPTLRQQVRALIPPYDSPIYRTWQRLGGESGSVGSPFRGESTDPNGVTNAQFTGADLWWKSGLGTHEVQGAIRDKYRAFAAVDDLLGVPTSNQRTGHRAGTRYNVFEGGRIYWSGQTGAHVLYGPLLKRYLRLGADGSRLRQPRTDVRTGHLSWARYAAFRGGRIYWSRRTGARQVWGPILRRYARMGADGSRLRLPTTAWYDVRGGKAQRFQRGTIRWDRRTGRTTVSYR